VRLHKAKQAVVIGAGFIGLEFAAAALKLGVAVTVLEVADRAMSRALSAPMSKLFSREHSKSGMRFLFNTQLKRLIDDEGRVAGVETVDGAVLDADLVIGAVLVVGARAPKLISNELVSRMKPGSVLVDISIDQGGCFETSRPTTHAEPTYVLDGVIHYAVTNMPGAVPRTSTFALTNATLPYVKALADHGWRTALSKDPGLAQGLNVHAGQLTHEAVASALGLDYRAYRAA